MNHSARRIHALKKHLNFQKYLEIGVHNGTTFNKVDIAHKTAVDPEFLFEIKETQHARFCREPSDSFFVKEPMLPVYDVVFIDGLHIFEQVLRDFFNTLLRTNEKSVILIDDTLPSDVYSAIPDSIQTFRLRKEDGGSDHPAWHGDVYKIVFFIHDFFPGLNYRTVIENGNPQTVVWRAKGVSRTPIFGSLEKISRLTYFDLLNHKHVLQEATEAETIDLCVREIKQNSQ